MSLTILCNQTGINTGGPDCAPVPGVGKYLVIWGGILTASQLALGYTTCKNQLIAHSKLSKNNSSKLAVFPIIREFVSKKEANTEAKMADGYSQVTREGLPVYEFKIKSDMYLVPMLRKLNNIRLRYAIVDDKFQFLATGDANGNIIGRAGKLFTDGIDAHGLSNVSGETMIQLNAENAFETFDNAVGIQLDKSPELLFKYIKDIQLVSQAAPTISGGTTGTAPTGSVTITAVGAVGDTWNATQGSVSITNGPVLRTASESTPTLLAAKIATAINAYTGTSGYSASAATGVITVTGPVGTALNGTSLTPVLVGTITNSIVAFSGGVATVYTNVTLHISGQVVPSPNGNVVIDFYSDYAASALGSNVALWSVTKVADGSVVTPTSVNPNASGYFDLVLTNQTPGDYVINLVAPNLLDAALVLGIEGNAFTYTKP